MAREWWPFLYKITWDHRRSDIGSLFAQTRSAGEKKLKQYIGTLKYNFTIISAQKTYFDANIARKQMKPVPAE